MYANDGGHPSVTSDDWLHMQYAYTSWCIISERKPDGTLLTYQLLALLEFIGRQMPPKVIGRQMPPEA